MREHIVEARSIGKAHRDSWVLRDVSLEVGRGDFVSIMGPSGSGKSTLLSILAGLERPTRGAVRFAGVDLSSLGDSESAAFRRRRLGFVFQAFHLLPSMTVLDNVLLPLILDGRGDSPDARDRAADLLRSLGLGDRIRHDAYQLSGGEMQRVAVARALVTDPIAVLADEPTGNLDSRAGERVLELLRALVDARGIACVMVTHDPRAARHGTRLVTLRDGGIEHEQRIEPRGALRAVA